MSETDTALHDEEVFSDELPDAVLEVAGCKCWEGPASTPVNHCALNFRAREARAAW